MANNKKLGGPGPRECLVFASHPPFFSNALTPQLCPQNAQKVASSSTGDPQTTAEILGAIGAKKGPWAIRGRKLAPPEFEAEVLASCMELAATAVLQKAKSLEDQGKEVLLVEIAASILYSYDIVKQAAESVRSEAKWKDNPLVQRCV